MYSFINFFILCSIFMKASLFAASEPALYVNDLSSGVPQKSAFLCGYTISMPAGWKQVTDKEQVQKRTLWSFGNGNNSAVWVEEPVVQAWDGPQEISGFFTASAVKRDPSIGLGTFYDDTLRLLKQGEVSIHEKGMFDIKDCRCKWWVQSIGNGVIHQHCFMFARGNYLYTFCFTTDYLSEEKKATFEKIIKTVEFQ